MRKTLLAAAIWAVFAACGSPPDTPPARPNIILIVADDLGFGDVGVYGQKRIRTPQLDRMASEGLRFTNFYAGSTVCAPSRSVLMEGRHTGHSYIRGNKEVRPYGQEPIPDSILTVAEVLEQAGYETGLIGKWGLGGPGSPGHPNNQGFEHFFGYLGQRHAHNYYPEFLFHNGKRVDVAGNRLPEPKREDGAGEAVEKGTYSHDMFADSALAFIEKNRDQPFFLFLALTIPHANNEAGGRGMEVPDFGPYSDMDWPEAEKGFAAMVTRMDHDVGRILESLRTLEIDENTLVVFTSDNGPHAEGGHDPAFFDSNGTLRGIKRDLYEGGIRVPAIAWWPATIGRNQTSDHVAYFADVLPTFADIGGGSIPQHIDGITFAPLLGTEVARQSTSPQVIEHDYLYWEFYERGMAQAARMGNWKGIRPAPDSPLELYDLGADISESNDLAAEHPEIAARIERIFDEAHVPSNIQWALDRN